MNRLKILFIAGWYPTDENLAAGIFIRRHVKAVSLYNDVVVIYPERAKKPIKCLYEYSDRIEDGIRTIRLNYRRSPVPMTDFIFHCWGMLKIFRRLIKDGFRPDIIHLNVCFAGVPAVILSKIYRIPLVITEHYSGFVGYPSLKGVNSQAARFVMKNAKVVLPVSEYLGRYIAGSMKPRRQCVIPNVVDTELFYPAHTPTQMQGAKKILFVGLLEAVKGIPYLLRALDRLANKRDDFFLDIVGDGNYRAEYERLTAKLGLGDMVRFQGIRPKNEVAEFIRKCDFLVQPSLYETFGIAPYEALATGKPVIVSDLDAFREHLTNEMALFVPPKDVTALAQAIDYMLDHYQEYNPEQLAQYVRNKFSYEIIGTQFNNIYQSIVVHL
ncbi:MAG: glycosyltransferase [Planctomycetes bacterium]|nr:glycosyltransferase [Planctomycetota bacterium]